VLTAQCTPTLFCWPPIHVTSLNVPKPLVPGIVFSNRSLISVWTNDDTTMTTEGKSGLLLLLKRLTRNRLSASTCVKFVMHVVTRSVRRGSLDKRTMLSPRDAGHSYVDTASIHRPLVIATWQKLITAISLTTVLRWFLADRTATQYDRLLASSCCPSVRLSVCLWRCALWLSGSV